jgi:hypothetical protein
MISSEHNGAPADMCAFTDHDQVADLRIVFDDAQNPGFAADASIAHDLAFES